MTGNTSFTEYYQDNQIREYEMCGACSTRGRGQKYAPKVLVGKKTERKGLLEGLGVVVRVLKKCGCEDVLWIHLAQGRNQWRALVNTVMNLQCS